MHIKSVKIFAVILTSCLCTLTCNASNQLAKNGKTDYSIVTGGSPQRLEKMAADELLYFLREMTGAEFKLIPETERAAKTGKRIFLGDTDFARKHGVEQSAMSKEEWRLLSVGDDLIISGGVPVGTLYGVYDFLERQGVYFLTVAEKVVPKYTELSVGKLDVRKQPDFAGRNLHVNLMHYARKPSPEFTRQYRMFRLRSRSNGESVWRFKGLYTGEMFNFTYQYGQYHNFFRYVSPDKYFASNPEYFSMTPEGKRYAGYKSRTSTLGGQLCLTNRDVWDITLDSLRKYIANDRKSLPKEDWPVIYDISAMDGTTFICRCPECKTVTKEEGGDESGLVLRYINHVAREIAKEYPEIMIRTFAYTSAELAPKLTRPEKNVIIQYCDLYTRSDCFRPLSHPFNAGQLKKIQDWHAIGARLAIWDYWNMGGKFYWPPRMETNINAIAPDLRILRKNGVEAYFTQAEITPEYPQTFLELQHFLGYQLLVDVDKDPEQLIDIFINNYYGKAADIVKKLLNEVRQGIKNDPKRQLVMTMKSWDYHTPEFVVASYMTLREAEGLADSEAHKRHVRELRLSLIWHTLFYKSRFTEAFAAQGVSQEQLLEECKKLSLEYMDKYDYQDKSRIISNFNNRFELISANLPVPERFKNYPQEHIRVFGYPHFYMKPNNMKVEAPDSPTGFALKSTPARSPMLEQGDRVRIGCENIDVRRGSTLSIPKSELPQDEKFHWYKIPQSLIIGNSTQFWADGWWLTFDLSSAYIFADGAEHINEWDVWFSAKFTGPAFVKGSEKGNAIAVDMVVLVRPDGWSE